MTRDPDLIAADFLTIPFEDHEAKLLAHAYFALKRKLDEPLTCATCGDSMAPLAVVSSPASEASQHLGRTDDATNRDAEVAVPHRASASEESSPAKRPS